jgi:hypothetical protein
MLVYRVTQMLKKYQNALRAFDLGRSTWSLYGLLMRSAQSIGLHRDGSHLQLSVFNTEMRRRLWWLICVAEARAAEDHGVSILGSVSDPAATKWPSNLDDSDLSPDMTTLPKPKQKWTAVTFSLIILETTVRLPELYRTAQIASSARPDETFGSQILKDRMAHLDITYLRHCNRLIPAQLTTWLMARFLALKNSFVGIRTLKLPGNISNHGYGATEEFLVTACEVLELTCQIQTEDLLQDFHWIFVTYVPYHPLTYVLWHLCVKPVGPNTKRAWKAVKQFLDLQTVRKDCMSRDVRWTIVKILKRKADQRMKEFANPHSSIHLGDNLMEESQVPENFNASPDNSFQDPSLWDITATNFEDWSILADNYNLYGFESRDPFL